MKLSHAATQTSGNLRFDIIGKYRTTPVIGGRKCAMKSKKNKVIYLQTTTMIDPATGWIVIRSVPEATANLVANQVELAWLNRHPLTN